MLRKLLIFGFMVFSFHTASKADLVYDFRFDQTGYSAISGSTVQVDIIFRETATAGESLRFFSTSLGLTGLGPVGVSYQSNAPATNVLSIAGASSISVNSLFVDGVFNSFDNSSHTAEIGGQRNAGIKISSNLTSYEISLGTIRFDVAGNAGDTATLELSDNLLGTVFFNNSIFPTTPVSYDTATFTVLNATAVPEPTSLGLATLAVLAGTPIMRRRFRKPMKSLVA